MSKRKSPTSANQQGRNRNITVAVVALIGAVMLCSGIVVGGGIHRHIRVGWAQAIGQCLLLLFGAEQEALELQRRILLQGGCLLYTSPSPRD